MTAPDRPSHESDGWSASQLGLLAMLSASLFRRYLDGVAFFLGVVHGRAPISEGDLAHGGESLRGWLGGTGDLVATRSHGAVVENFSTDLV